VQLKETKTWSKNQLSSFARQLHNRKNPLKCLKLTTHNLVCFSAGGFEEFAVSYAQPPADVKGQYLHTMTIVLRSRSFAIH
jgi:hypothetical protein